MRTGREDDSSMNLWTWKRENLPSISAKQSVCWQTRKWHRRRGAARFERIRPTEKTSVAASILFRARCESAWGLRWHDQVPQRGRFDLPNESNLGAYGVR